MGTPPCCFRWRVSDAKKPQLNNHRPSHGHPYISEPARLVTGMAYKTKIIRRSTAVPEWKLQAAQVRALRAMPEYGRSFLFVGGMEAGRRGPQAATIAKATGLTAGHPDLTIFMLGSRCAFIENKTAEAAKKKKRTSGLDPAQVERHEALRRLGHTVEVIVAANEDEAAEAAVAFVRGLL